jgi:DNA-directed RNA polymerase specialized sigma24 family protein
MMSDKNEKSELGKLRNALDKLTRDERLVCIWKRAGFSARDIAEYHGRSVDSVDKTFARARQKLRESFRDFEVTPLDGKKPRPQHATKKPRKSKR